MGVNIDGWVPNDRYEAIKEGVDDLKAQMIAEAENDVDRKDIEDNWPFQDHEEIDQWLQPDSSPSQRYADGFGKGDEEHRWRSKGGTASKRRVGRTGMAENEKAAILLIGQAAGREDRI